MRGTGWSPAGQPARPAAAAAPADPPTAAAARLAAGTRWRGGERRSGSRAAPCLESQSPGGSFSRRGNQDGPLKMIYLS